MHVQVQLVLRKRSLFAPSPVGVVEPPDSDLEEVSDDEAKARMAFERGRNAYIETATHRYSAGIQFGELDGLAGGNGYRRVKFDEQGRCHFATSSKGAAERRKAKRLAEGEHQSKAAAMATSRNIVPPSPPPPPSQPPSHMYRYAPYDLP